MISAEDISDIKAEFDGKWAGDARHRFTVGEVGFLMELKPEYGQKRLEVRDSPVRTAGSLDDILFGEVSGGRTFVEALGVAKITEVAKNGRGKVQTLWGEDLDAALLELGYPEIDRKPYVH